MKEGKEASQTMSQSSQERNLENLGLSSRPLSNRRSGMRVAFQCLLTPSLLSKAALLPTLYFYDPYFINYFFSCLWAGLHRSSSGFVLQPFFVQNIDFLKVNLVDLHFKTGWSWIGRSQPDPHHVCPRQERAEAGGLSPRQEQQGNGRRW